MQANFLLNTDGSFFKNIVSSFKVYFENPVANIFDVLILTLVLFFSVRFIRGRKAGVLLIGITVLLLITGVAYYFDFPATKAVFSAVFSVGIIALVIIFHPEIRDALEKVGSGSINGIMSFGDQKKKNAAYNKAIEDISVAVNDLSAKKTGALIVISRNISLDDIINTGVKLNAEVSSFLLRNLFFDKAPLHDGAVVIDNGKISAAGCLLPLTRRTDLDSDLGTRHRAAIGMSEVSDAIIIIVSEETGTISVASDCTLTRDYTADSLRKYLTEVLIKPCRSYKKSENIDNEQ